MSIINEDYTIISTCVQLWGLPEFCKTSEAAKKIGVRIGRVLGVMAIKVRGGKGQIMKAKINLNVTETLKQWIKVASPNCTTHEILLRYECLGLYCSYCGFISHGFRNWNKFLEDLQDQQQLLLKWSANMKEDQMRWKVDDSKENNNPNFGRKEGGVNHTRKKPTSVSLLKSFSQLYVRDQTNTIPNQNHTLHLLYPTPNYYNNTSTSALSQPQNITLNTSRPNTPRQSDNNDPTMIQL
ncbi:hypothetical protein AHAS_Ahas11G0129600 [Arachis hypogaea]